MNRVFGDRKTILILLIPPLAIYVLLKVVPVLWSLGLSFFEGNTLRGFEFVGIQNFTTFFTDGAALQSLWVSVELRGRWPRSGRSTLGYLLALLYVFVLRTGSAFVRTAVFFPMVLPTVAVALLFRSLVAVGENQGPVNDVINFFGGVERRVHGLDGRHDGRRDRHDAVELDGLLRGAAVHRPARHPRRDHRVGPARRRRRPAPRAAHHPAAVAADPAVVDHLQPELDAQGVRQPARPEQRRPGHLDVTR